MSCPAENGAEDGDGRPALSRRLAFWLFLGLVSTAFAEVLFPNTPFDPVLILSVLVPVYLLHSVFFAGVLFSTNRVTYSTLYLSGVVFGLYEAYVTKVVWAPVGDPLHFRLGGVYWFETVSLVLFWHPVVAFVIPVALLEAVATGSGRSFVPPIAGHGYTAHLAVAMATYLAVFQGTLGRGPVTTVLKSTVALGVVLGFLLLWRRTNGHRYTMESLLPSGRELWALGVALLVMYLLFGATVRPEALPREPVPHLIVLAIYAVVGGLLFVTLRCGSTFSTAEPTGSVVFSWRRASAAAGAFVVTSLGAGVLLGPLRDVVFLSYFSVGVAIGVVSLARVGVCVSHRR
jgi:hypothetical protein